MASSSSASPSPLDSASIRRAARIAALKNRPAPTPSPAPIPPPVVPVAVPPYKGFWLKFISVLAALIVLIALILVGTWFLWSNTKPSAVVPVSTICATGNSATVAKANGTIVPPALATISSEDQAKNQKILADLEQLKSAVSRLQSQPQSQPPSVVPTPVTTDSPVPAPAPVIQIREVQVAGETPTVSVPAIPPHFRLVTVEGPAEKYYYPAGIESKKFCLKKHSNRIGVSWKRGLKAIIVIADSRMFGLWHHRETVTVIVPVDQERIVFPKNSESVQFIWTKEDSGGDNAPLTIEVRE